MKIMVIGDCHFRRSNPVRRVDDFFGVQFRKFEWCLEMYAKNSCDVLVIPGDMFDAPYVGNYVQQKILKLLSYEVYQSPSICTVWGQHDLYFRSEKQKDKTALKVLESAGVIQILTDTPITIKRCAFYGASFGEEIPKVADKDFINILVIHKMISDAKLPYDYTDARRFLESCISMGYSLVISGDNHKEFAVSSKGRFLLNPGTMSRKTLAEYKHEPMVWIITIDGRDGFSYNCSNYKIPIQPAEEVFSVDGKVDLTTGDRDLELDSLMKEFREVSTGCDLEQYNVKDILEKYLEDERKKIRRGVRDLLADVITSLKV